MRRWAVACGIALVGWPFAECGLDQSRAVGAVSEAGGGKLALALPGVAVIAPAAGALPWFRHGLPLLTLVLSWLLLGVA